MVVNERVGILKRSFLNICIDISSTTLYKVRNPAVSSRVSCFRDVRLDRESGDYHENIIDC